MTEYDRDQGEVKYGRTQLCVDSDWGLDGGKFAGNKSEIHIIFCTSAHIAILSSCCLDAIAAHNLTQRFNRIDNCHLSVSTLA